MKAKVKNRVLNLLIQVSELGEQGMFPIPEISFDLKGRTAGMCRLAGTQCTLRFNPKLLKENREDFLQFTVPHEVAHYITALLYGKVRPHGKEWQSVMNFFGIKHPQRCHSYDLENTWVYKCQCREHRVGPRQHSMIIKGARTYACRICGGPIELVGKKT